MDSPSLCVCFRFFCSSFLSAFSSAPIAHPFLEYSWGLSSGPCSCLFLLSPLPLPTLPHSLSLKFLAEITFIMVSSLIVCRVVFLKSFFWSMLLSLLALPSPSSTPSPTPFPETSWDHLYGGEYSDWWQCSDIHFSWFCLQREELVASNNRCKKLQEAVDGMFTLSHSFYTLGLVHSIEPLSRLQSYTLLCCNFFLDLLYFETRISFCHFVFL